ncbi:hypothetical protein C1645_834428 [Glomus cerebriforme]|uniref:Uncharacterized protein n=1 Tax=Glomus cerebriforme TaxID=658196 RepID=A0A397SC14_9GLOM|nr:hypothetical protein C1645_834428 [Glomus cerebriforme]
MNREEGGNEITSGKDRWDTENWIHIWNCNKNETTIYEIINEEIELQIKELEKDFIKVNERKWKQRITDILLTRSNNYNGQYIFHEIIKGIFNKQLYEMEKDKNIKMKMEILITNIARKAYNKIWNKRCKKVTEIE